jgi:hypothetical protein
MNTMPATNTKLGDIRYSVQCWQERNGKFAALIKVSKRVRFQRSQRVGWKSMGWTTHTFPRFDTRKEAQEAAAAIIKTLKKDN